MNSQKSIFIALIIMLLGCPLKVYGVENSAARDELIAEIKDEVGSDNELLEAIPELKRQKGDGVTEIYIYIEDGKEVKLEDLDESKLKEIINEVLSKKRKIQDSFRNQEIQTALDAQKHPPGSPPMPPERHDRI